MRVVRFDATRHGVRQCHSAHGCCIVIGARRRSLSCKWPQPAAIDRDAVARFARDAVQIGVRSGLRERRHCVVASSYRSWPSRSDHEQPVSPAWSDSCGSASARQIDEAYDRFPCRQPPSLNTKRPCRVTRLHLPKCRPPLRANQRQTRLHSRSGELDSLSSNHCYAEKRNEKQAALAVHATSPREVLGMIRLSA